MAEPERLNQAEEYRRAQERADVYEAEDQEWATEQWLDLMEEAAERGMLNARPDSPDNPLTPPG